MRKPLLAPVLFLLGVTLAMPTIAAGDADRGKGIFKKCQVCHVLDKEKNRVGPHLVRLFGRQAGTLPNYKYSNAMRSAAITWDETTLDAYIEAPRAYLKGTKMAVPGLKKPADRADLIAFMLEAVSAAGD